MDLISAISLAARYDAIIALVFAAAFVALMPPLLHRRRPPTMHRLMDAWLASILFFVLGMRFLVTAICVMLAPEAVLGQSGPPGLVATVTGVSAVLAAIGILSHRGSIGFRVFGAVTLAVATVAELLLDALVLAHPVGTWIDLIAAVALAAAALVLAAFHWSHRTATPNPLGGDSRPLDY